MLAAIDFSLLKDKRLAYGAIAILALGMLVSLVKEGTTIYQQHRWQMPTLAATATPTTTAIPDIARWHLFGISPNINHVANIPKTDLQYKLVGILTLGDFAPAQAIIETPGQDVKIYTQGQQLPGDATITQITPTQVLLSRNNQLEVLPLKMYSEEGKS